MSTLAERISEAMRRHPALSQADIARACGVSTPSVTDWLNGKTKSLKLRTAQRAARLFGCDQNWIGAGVGAPHWLDATPADPAAERDEAAALTPRQRALLDLFEGLTAKQQDEVMQGLAATKERNEELIRELGERRRTGGGRG